MNTLTFERSIFNGVFAATLIPMQANLNVDHQELRSHCHDLIKRGCRGIALFGTTGEGASFSVEERKQAVKKLIEGGIHPKQIIVGICCSVIKDAVELAQTALETDCLGTLVMPPFFYKNVKDEGVIAFYREIIQRICNPDLRMILYHIPQYSGVPLNGNIVTTLSKEFPDIIIGMKDSEGNLSLMKEILEKCPGLKLFAGREQFLSEAIQCGAVGGISGMANVFPELICSLYEYGKDSKKDNRNGEIQCILEILKGYPIFPALKNILERKRGILWHPLRPPLIPLTSEQSQILVQSLAHFSLCD